MNNIAELLPLGVGLGTGLWMQDYAINRLGARVRPEIVQQNLLVGLVGGLMIAAANGFEFGGTVEGILNFAGAWLVGKAVDVIGHAILSGISANMAPSGESGRKSSGTLIVRDGELRIGDKRK